MNHIQSLTLVTVVFCIGAFGILTRRDWPSQVIALSLVFIAPLIVISLGNHWISPVSADGYAFAALAAIVAMAWVGVLVVLGKRADRFDAAADDSGRSFVGRGGELGASEAVEAHAAYRPSGAPFQIAVILGVALGYALWKVTIVGCAAFVFGLCALLWSLHRRMRNLARQVERHPSHAFRSTDDGGGEAAADSHPHSAMFQDE